MEWLKAFLSFSGRMNRAQFIGNHIVAVGVMFLAVFLCAALSFSWVAVVLFIPVVFVAYGRVFAISARRCHDMNWSPILGIIYATGFMTGMMRAQAFIGCLLIGTPLFLILAFWPGNKTANEYGPVPGEEEEPAAVRTVSAQPTAKPEYVKPAAASTQMPKPAVSRPEYVKPAAQPTYTKPAAAQPTVQPAAAQPSVQKPQFTLASFGSLQTAAERLVGQCFLFTDYTGRSVPFPERLNLYTVFGLQPSQISEGEKNWLSFEITMLRFFRLKELLRSDTASAEQIRLAAELDIAFREKYQSNASYLSIVNNRLARYETLARECGGDTGKFYEKAAPVVFATANIEDERLRLHMLSQEVAAWESMMRGTLSIAQ